MDGDASSTGKINTISATTESGLNATLAFADVNGRRLLQTLTYPDVATTVQYAYDANGNLTTVSHPPNNAAGTRPIQYFGYQTVGADSVLLWASSPRWDAGPCCIDGAYLYFGFAGTSAATSTVYYIIHEGFANPTIPDGVSAGAIQPAFASGYTNFLTEYYGTGVTTPTFRDTDGHYTNWVVDGLGRPTQTQECTATTGTWTCTGTYLTTNETWDANNNLTSEMDPRGYQADYAYDAMGNAVAVAQPMVTVSQGTFRPTSLFSYDSFNNITAYCDPDATHALSSDWTSPPSGDSLCPITSLLAARFIWSTDPTQSGNASASPSYEPFGELLAKIEPGTPAAPAGYRVNYTYDPSRQGGTDYGLPTTVAAAASISQADGTQRQPSQNFWYDNNGWLGCYNKGSGLWVLGYDVLGRVTTTADPDDSTNNGICNKTSGMTGWNTASTIARFPDGSVSSMQSPSQRAAGISSTLTYDLDGNVSTETHHFGCTSVSSCTAGVTSKWYDGADRLVEVSLPYDAYDIQGYPMLTRYVYDLSQSGTTPYQGLGLRGYGNLVKTQEFLSGTVITPFTYQTASTFGQLPPSTGTWTDIRATSFDGLDRALSAYEAAFASQPKIANSYDGAPPGGGAAQLGLLSSVALATNETKQYTYDPLGHLTDTSYLNDNGATSPAHVRYDASGRVVSRGTDALGNEILQYDAAGELTTAAKPPSLGSATIGYDYYSDGARRDLNFSSPVYTAALLYQYSYRSDGHRSSLTLNNGTGFTWAYTPAGRLQVQTDPLTGRAISPDNYFTRGKSLTQWPHYPSSVTYVPETYSFDSYGRATGVTLPAGVFSQSVSGFDLDDGVTGLSALSVQAPTNVTMVTCATSNVRNEKLPTYRGSCAGRFYNGATFALQQTGLGLTPWTIDARAGMLKSWVGPMGPTDVSSGQFAYDASGRLTADTEQLNRAWRSGDPSMPGNVVYSTGTRTKSYDAENRLRSQQTSPAAPPTIPSWGESILGGYWNDESQPSGDEIQAVDYAADSHPARFAITQTPDAGTSATPGALFWLWDGSDLLAQCGYWSPQAQCATYGFSVEGLANYTPSNGYTSVQDRDLSGQVVASHDAMSFSGMKPIGRNSRTYFYPGLWASAAPNSASLETAGGLPGPATILAGSKIAIDGWTFDNNTWQGVRTYDASVGQWNTPDAFAGNVHDPMSQKPYMWNRNNPYAYSDPSGFAYEPACDAVCSERGSRLGALIWNFLFGDDIKTVMSAGAPIGARALAAASLASTVVDAPVKGIFKGLGIAEKAFAGFTEHGAAQFLARDGGRGVSTDALRDALTHPLSTKLQDKGTIMVTGRDAVVILNKDGAVVTTWATSNRGIRKK
jgi:YD repeat-containing protein